MRAVWGSSIAPWTSACSAVSVLVGIWLSGLFKGFGPGGAGEGDGDATGEQRAWVKEVPSLETWKRYSKTVGSDEFGMECSLEINASTHALTRPPMRTDCVPQRHGITKKTPKPDSPILPTAERVVKRRHYPIPCLSRFRPAADSAAVGPFGATGARPTQLRVRAGAPGEDRCGEHERRE